MINLNQDVSIFSKLYKDFFLDILLNTKCILHCHHDANCAPSNVIFTCKSGVLDVDGIKFAILVYKRGDGGCDQDASHQRSIRVENHPLSLKPLRSRPGVGKGMVWS